MAKEFNIVSTDDQSGYIVKAVDPEGDLQNGIAPSQKLSVHSNFGSVVKLSREFFGEQKAKKDGNPEQAE